MVVNRGNTQLICYLPKTPGARASEVTESPWAPNLILPGMPFLNTPIVELFICEDSDLF